MVMLKHILYFFIFCYFVSALIKQVQAVDYEKGGSNLCSLVDFHLASVVVHCALVCNLFSMLILCPGFPPFLTIYSLKMEFLLFLMILCWRKLTCSNFTHADVVVNYMYYCLQFTPKLCHHEIFMQL